MENEVKQRNQRNRRRERAQRMQAQRESKVKDGDSGEDESPAREKPPRPPARRKKSKEPLGEEDIIDGFAIMAFRTYEDLEAAVKCASSPRTASLTSKPRLPLAALPGDTVRPPNNVNNHGITLLLDAGTSDDSGRASERLTGSSIAPRDPDSSRDRLSDASSRCSSGKGYICDSEGDDDKASPDNSRNGSPRFHDVSMDDVSDAGSLFRVAGAGAGLGAVANAIVGAGAGGGKNELVARGGSGGALALSRAPVGGSASPAPAPLPQPAPSPAPAALPPPALPTPQFRPDNRQNGAHIPAVEGHAGTQIPARPVGAAGQPERPATKTGARATADSPTPAPPAPSPLFPSYPAHATLPDYRHTNHEARIKQESAPLNLHHRTVPATQTPVSVVSTNLPNQPVRPLSPNPQSSRSYPTPMIGSSHNITTSLNSGLHNHTMHYQNSNLQKHSSQPVYTSRPSHLAPFSVTNHLVTATTNGHTSTLSPASVSSQSILNHMHLPSTVISTTSVPTLTSSHNGPPAVPSHPGLVSSLPNFSHSHKVPGVGLSQHLSSLPTVQHATSNHMEISSASNVPSGAPAVVNIADSQPRSESAVTNGYPPPTAYSGAAYPPLYAPYATSLQHTPYLPPAAASPRNSDARTTLSSSPLVAPKTPKGVRPHTPGSTGAAGSAPLHAPHSYSPRGHSPTRERDSYSSNISSLSRASGSTPISSIAAVSSMPPNIATATATVTIPSVPSLPTPMPAPLAAPLPTPLSTPLPASISAPLAPSIVAPLAAPAATPAAPTPTHLSHSMAPVPTVGSISSSAKPPAHWGVTATAPDRPPGFGSTPLFGAPIPPPNPNPFSAESLFQTSPGADLLRRELDSRFLAAAGGAFSVRTEMHHHQHQHTHVHQHQPHHPPQLYVPHHPSLFKDVGKVPPLYRGGLSLGYPYSPGLLHPGSPYVPPSPLSTYPPKKSGKWNAMHVRIAWEIYNHQQKEKAGAANAPPVSSAVNTMSVVSVPDKDKLRSFPTPQPPYRSPYELPPSPYLPPHHPHLGISPFARYGAGAFPSAPPPPFGLSPYARELALSGSLHGVPHGPSLAALHDAWRPRPTAPQAPIAPIAPIPPPSDAVRREHEERERARRDREERERRDKEERRKQMERVRQRSPLRNGAPEIVKEERKEQPRPPPAMPGYGWDPYRFDPLQHMRFTPLVEAAIRAEEDRAKMLSAYAAHHQQLKGPMVHRPLPPPMGLPPLAPLGPLAPLAPLDLLKKEEPR